MSQYIVVYSSLSGNTEDIADLIGEGIKSTGHEVTVKDAMDCNASILKEYDAFCIGAYTWGDGELPDEFLDFFEEMDELDLTGVCAATFGSGDTTYEQFCASVDILEKKIVERGGTITQPGLKIEYSPTGDERELCQQFGINFVSHVKSC
ncbi:flavodoxin I [Paenibacillus turicensis]|uniref:Flavodoxin n=1 Tax=Paenibacillus turicensis TaxID=160487 RepID=A0ABS4FXG8_9BACL|nr:flavodoxin [Paenibacillus turicensis]MBP1907281.1 flavodoxin I [Paenibacillus turicensis]